MPPASRPTPWRVLAGEVRAVGEGAGRGGQARIDGRAAEWNPDRPLRPRRERGLPDHLQGSLRRAGRNLLRHGRAREPQRPRAAPEILAIGVAAIKVEGRQRSPAYVAQVTRTLRQAIDAAFDNPERFSVRRLEGGSRESVRGRAGDARRLQPALEVTMKIALDRCSSSGRKPRYSTSMRPRPRTRRSIASISAKSSARAVSSCARPTGSDSPETCAAPARTSCSRRRRSSSRKATFGRCAAVGRRPAAPSEANDLGAVKIARDKRVPFVCGPHLNIYNESTLAFYADARRGALGAAARSDRGARASAASGKAGGHGDRALCVRQAAARLLGALLHARHYGLNKDDCRFRCLDHPRASW